jgi:hypothetical protein
MKLSALLVLTVASTCIAQNTSISRQAAHSPSQDSQFAIVDDQALSHAASGVAAAAASKEIQKMMDRANQANCPVMLTSAGLTPHLMLLNATGDASENSLDLEFRNTSGKEIRSMEFSARILVKRTVYDLDYLPAIHLYLTAYGTRSLDATFAQLRHLSLPADIHPSLVENVTLEQVTFADGSLWTSRGDRYCGFSPNQTLPVAR